jgi:hypothetical protein
MQLPAGSRNGFAPWRWADGTPDDLGGRLWWLIPGQVDAETALAMCDAYAYGGGAGRSFADKPWVRSTRTRTLVVQRCGLDV